HRLTKPPNLVGALQTSPFPNGFIVNRTRFPKQAAKMHEALLYATDRDKINKELNGGTLFVSDYIFEHVTWGDMHTPPANLKKYPFDPDKARAIVKEVGWDTNKEAEWMIWRNPTPTYLAIQAMLADVGIKSKFRQIDI